MKRSVFMFALVPFLVGVASAAPSSFFMHGNEVQVIGGNLFGNGPHFPTQQLAVALKRYPKNRVFRVTWDSSATLGRDRGIALYNRDAHTLKFVYSQNWQYDNEVNQVECNSEVVFLYSHVTDASLQKLAAQNANNYDGADAQLAFFPRLQKLGSKRRQLKHYYHRVIKN
jgi:hypothetical protein